MVTLLETSYYYGVSCFIPVLRMDIENVILAIAPIANQTIIKYLSPRNCCIMLDSPECRYIFALLEKDLPGYLKYHTVAHTMDVYTQAERIAGQEGVAGRELELLLVAAAYHDSGYLYQREGHEFRSCDIAEENLLKFNYNPNEIAIVRSVIMATRLPQHPKSHIEQIICDADLDYLGRDDFFETGEGLYREMLHYGIVSNEIEWDQLQLQFLESHQFFTETSKRNRNEKKQENINALKAKLGIADGRNLL